MNRNDLNFEGTFLLARALVIHIEKWQYVRPAKLIPKVAQNDIAYSQHCLHRMCVPSILDVTTNILHIRCRGCFCLTQIIFSLFFSPPPLKSCDTDKPCFHRQSNDHLTRFLEKTPFPCVLTHYYDGMSAGEQQLLE